MTSVEMHTTTYPSMGYAQMLLQNPNFTSKFPKSYKLDFDRVKNSILAVNIYHKSNEYTLVEQSPAKTPEALLSDFGGQLGLFIGCSFLSFLEIFEVLIKVAYVYFQTGRDIQVTNDFNPKINTNNIKL